MGQKCLPNTVPSHATQVELQGLAMGLCRDSGIRVAVGDGCWSYDHEANLISVPSGDLASRGLAYCLGVLSHEVGHFHISRYHDLGHGIPFPSDKILAHLLNATEDPRVNTWIKKKFPGTVPWFDRLRVDFLQPPVGAPDLFCFAVECHGEEMRGWVPSPAGSLPPLVERALEGTRRARTAMASCLPTTLPGMVLLDQALASRCGHALAEMPPIEQKARDARELEVLVRQAESLGLFRDHVAPVALALLESDILRIGWHLLKRGLLARTHRLARKGWAHGRAAATLLPEVGEAMRLVPQPPTTWVPSKEDRAGILRLLEHFLDGQFPMKPLAAPVPRGGCPGARRDPGEAAGGPGPREACDGSRAVPPHPATTRGVDQLERLVREGLNPHRLRRFHGSFAAGCRLSMREAMRMGAEPERYRKLWQRRIRPTRPDAAFGLLVDLSGSMAGEKVRAAVRGTLLLAETLGRLDVPCIVHGFQDVLIPFVGWEERFNGEVRGRIESMELEAGNGRPGGNNHAGNNDDGPCLEEFALLVGAHPARQKFLVVVSDGIPAGRRSGPDDLKTAVQGVLGRGGIHLIGLGLGGGTEHVRDFYPRSMANVPEVEFPTRIGRLILEACGVG